MDLQSSRQHAFDCSHDGVGPAYTIRTSPSLNAEIRKHVGAVGVVDIDNVVALVTSISYHAMHYDIRRPCCDEGAEEL